MIPQQLLQPWKLRSPSTSSANLARAVHHSCPLLPGLLVSKPSHCTSCCRMLRHCESCGWVAFDVGPPKCVQSNTGRVLVMRQPGCTAWCSEASGWIPFACAWKMRPCSPGPNHTHISQICIRRESCLADECEHAKGEFCTPGGARGGGGVFVWVNCSSVNYLHLSVNAALRRPRTSCP